MKKFFNSDSAVSKVIFGVILLVVFSLVFGPTLYASFVGTAGDVDVFEYQSGYDGSVIGLGYGYGYGGNAVYGFLGADGKATSVSATNRESDNITVGYTTNYTSYNRINYGLTDSFGSNSSQSALETGTNSIEITGLVCNTTYHYRVETTDAAGNLWYSTDTSHTSDTAACATNGGGGGGSSSSATPATPATPAVPGVTPATPATPAVPAHKFNSDLTIGSTGPDVVTLQQFLVAQGYLVMPAGVPMGKFGALTKAAVIKYQIANNISPAVGYVGPVTRAQLNAGGISIETLVNLLINLGIIGADKAALAKVLLGL